MSQLFKFLKRNSSLFVAKYGAALKINEHYNKFLLDRYGTVKHYYTGNTEFAVIEADIKSLIAE